MAPVRAYDLPVEPFVDARPSDPRAGDVSPRRRRRHALDGVAAFGTRADAPLLAAAEATHTRRRGGLGRRIREHRSTGGTENSLQVSRSGGRSRDAGPPWRSCARRALCRPWGSCPPCLGVPGSPAASEELASLLAIGWTAFAVVASVAIIAGLSLGVPQIVALVAVTAVAALLAAKRWPGLPRTPRCLPWRRPDCSASSETAPRPCSASTSVCWSRARSSPSPIGTGTAGRSGCRRRGRSTSSAASKRRSAASRASPARNTRLRCRRVRCGDVCVRRRRRGMADRPATRARGSRLLRRSRYAARPSRTRLDPVAVPACACTRAGPRSRVQRGAR